MQLCVTVYLPGQEGEKFAFEHGDVTLGRADDNDLVLGERGVSGRHARLLVTGDEVTLIDLESTNGTYVNGQRIFGPVVLGANDDIALCEYRLLVSLGEAPARAVVPRVTAPPPMVDGPDAGQRVSLAHDASSPTGPIDRSIPPPAIEHNATVAPAMLEPGLPSHPASSFIGTEGGDGLDRAVAGGPRPAEPPSAASSVAPPLVQRVTAVPADRRPDPAAAEILPVPSMMRPSAPPSHPVDVGAGVAVDAAHVEQRGAAETAEPPIVAPTDPRPHAPAATPHVAAPGSPPAEVPADTDAMTPRHQEITSPHVTDRPSSAAGAFTVDDPWLQSQPDGSASNGRASPAASIRRVADQGVALVGSALGSSASGAVGAAARFAPGTRPLQGLDDVYALLCADRGLASDHARIMQVLTQIGLGDDARSLAFKLQAEIGGADPVSEAVADPELTDLWLAGADQLVVRRGGSVEVVARPFSCAMALNRVIERFAGRRFAADEPLVDVFTSEGVHVRAVHSSWTQAGTALWATPVGAAAPGLDDLVRAGEMSQQIADLLAVCVEQGLRLLVCGGPDVSTAPLLHALAASAPDHMRQVVVCCGHSMPDTARHALVLRAPRQDALRGLIDTALQFDPRRLLVHGLGGAEASVGLLALARLPAGGVLSLQAATATDGLRRLATMFRLAEGCSQEIASSYIAGAIDLVVGVGKIADGRQLVLEIAEAALPGGDAAPGTAIPVAVYDGSGGWAATGSTPRFFSDLQRRGVHLP